ncbi:hypothetical protein BURMUCGD2M_6531 [Burkholderia multivorans CGD2M]|uniref:Uncharacterized protein n=1 Tax=Burkholderia multivorans CGD2 TaxID=513052 RepID=B9BPC0_9BURK|nr:hypothetical protein BURMUCGD2_6541 [Burkholderia multivorans CGD2]EEE13809.1 hypothetical protein BURMUCGD2M_6531 [Burkholderia multivorans CGD2M]
MHGRRERLIPVAGARPSVARPVSCCPESPALPAGKGMPDERP